MGKIDLELIKNHPTMLAYMELGNKYIGAIGAIEHNLAHANKVSQLSYDILYRLGFPKHEAELAAIAGYLHDVGNLVNRYGHGASGALMVFDMLVEQDADPEDIAIILGAIGMHEEHAGGYPVNSVGAAVILADKSDVSHTRVRKHEIGTFTTRDRVHYAAREASLEVDPDELNITMRLLIDTDICPVMDYFEIFMVKMMMCKRSAEFLGCRFALIINDARLI